MLKANQDIRAELRASGLTVWQLAILLGVSEITMVKKMRLELSGAEKAEIRQAISKFLQEVRDNAQNENN